MYACVLPAPRIRRTGVTDGFEFLCECKELNSGPLLEQPVPLITEQTLQSHIYIVFAVIILVFLFVCFLSHGLM